ncbi:MAG: DUF4089 domain-containing protein [Usitatibacter sp.]
MADTRVALGPPSFDAEAYVDAASRALNLPLDPAHRPGVVANMERIAHFAAIVMESPLDEGFEPAPVFRA